MLSAGAVRLGVSRSMVEGLLQNGCKRVVVAGPVQIQVATMKATHGDKYPYAKRWPESKKFTLFNEFFDSTTARMNENSKVITVEGNVGVGKREFARRLADEFDLKVIDPTPDSKCFLYPDTNFDFRILDEFLPEGAKGYDLQRFMNDPNPKQGRVGRLQLYWYREKVIDYASAIAHLLNTGQGVVLVRSAFSDMVFTEALRKVGWITRNFNMLYNEVRAATVCELLPPHLTIYLDAPLDVIKQRIAKRNNPLEKNSPNITDAYLQAIDSAYKEKFLPQMRVTGEVLEIDWAEIADDMDMDVIAEEISLLELQSEDNEDKKFRDWGKLDEEELCYIRRISAEPWFWAKKFAFPIPFQCPEILFNQEEADAFTKHVIGHPAIRYKKGWSRELGNDVAFRI